jgi:hypothetical protein
MMLILSKVKNNKIKEKMLIKIKMIYVHLLHQKTMKKIALSKNRKVKVNLMCLYSDKQKIKLIKIIVPQQN